MFRSTYRCAIHEYQGAGIGIVLVVVNKNLYPIPDQYQSFKGNAAIINK